MRITERVGNAGLGAVPVGILAVFTLFLIAIAYLVASSLMRRSLPTFDPSPVQTEALGGDTVIDDTVTIDARDPERWQFFDFDRRSVVPPPDTTGWDLAFRRFQIIASGGVAALDAEWEERVPSEERFLTTRMAKDTVNPAIDRWYEYSFLSHLLEPKAMAYAIRTTDGRFAKMRIVSYYCPGLAAGCLTIRYTYPLPADTGV